MCKSTGLRFDHEKESDVIKKVFTDADRQWLSGFKVYRHDSLLVNWEGPPREMGTEIHHFYNYNSWERYRTSKYEGVVLFTIKILILSKEILLHKITPIIDNNNPYPNVSKERRSCREKVSENKRIINLFPVKNIANLNFLIAYHFIFNYA